MRQASGLPRSQNNEWGSCYGLNVCIPNHKRDGIWRQGLWRWGHEGETSIMGLVPLHMKRNRPKPSHLSTMWKARRRPSATRKRALTRTPLCWHQDLVHPVFRTVKNKCLFFKSPNLWYFVRVAQTKTAVEIHGISIPGRLWERCSRATPSVRWEVEHPLPLVIHSHPRCLRLQWPLRWNCLIFVN